MKVLQDLGMQARLGRFGDPVSCFRTDTRLRSKLCASASLDGPAFRQLAPRSKHLERLRSMVGRNYQLVFCTNAHVHHLYRAGDRNHGRVCLLRSSACAPTSTRA